MRRRKEYKPPFQDRSRAGEKSCHMGGKPLTGRKNKWCGEQGKDLAFVRKGDHAAMRRFLYGQDNGICAGCGVDLRTIKELGQILRGYTNCTPCIEKPKHVLNRVWYKTCRSWGVWSYKEWIEFLKELDIDPGCHMHYWEADHIVPFSEGGQHHEDNLQILCLNCHHKKAVKRKVAEQMKLF